MGTIQTLVTVPEYLPDWEQAQEAVKWLYKAEKERFLFVPTAVAKALERGDVKAAIGDLPEVPWIGESVNALAQKVWDILVWIVNKVKKLLWEWLGAHKWKFIALVAIGLLVWVVYRALSGCAGRLFCE